ncbi:hypothetical protein ICV00_03020 [Polynucleobacter asymbioticus]|nr:hypothetical protein ICV00_03020 [Polynucleobacter asymbioticus]
MLPRSKTIALVLCLFLMAFKAVASGIFVQSALERAHHVSAYSISAHVQESHDNKDSGDDKQPQASSLNLMSHITANLSDIGFAVLFIPYQTVRFGLEGDSLHSQNYPDTAFKPPKAAA